MRSIGVELLRGYRTTTLEFLVSTTVKITDNLVPPLHEFVEALLLMCVLSKFMVRFQNTLIEQKECIFAFTCFVIGIRVRMHSLILSVYEHTLTCSLLFNLYLQEPFRIYANPYRHKKILRNFFRGCIGGTQFK